jgi:phosphatidate cytidylyltransferase
MGDAAPEGKKKSDLGVRTASAVVMLVVAGGVLWLGGWVFNALVIAVGLGVLWEFWGLARSFTVCRAGLAGWMLFACVYVGLSMLSLYDIRTNFVPALFWTSLLFFIVWGTDIGAYLAGRTIGGPKIAPSVSPSKTWAGLIGGMLTSLVIMTCMSILYFSDRFDDPNVPHSSQTAWEATLSNWPVTIILGLVIPVVAQAGDFFESGLKRAADVKDSGHLIPGHGGLFDRVDGLIPAAIVFNILVKILTW